PDHLFTCLPTRRSSDLIDAPAGGELRLSLSSLFDSSEAERFRCPLHRADQPDDVVDMLIALLHDCRVSDVRMLPGVHPDRDPARSEEHTSELQSPYERV